MNRYEWNRANAEIRIERVFAMPDHMTFRIAPIANLIASYWRLTNRWVDPFCGCSQLASLRNDLNPAVPNASHLDAVDFCRQLEGTFDGCFWDPPYSLEQIKRAYQGIGKLGKGPSNPNGGFTEAKALLAPHIRPLGYAISCGWNSNGFGKKLGFLPLELLVVHHGGNHHDTLVLVEQKSNDIGERRLS